MKAFYWLALAILISLGSTQTSGDITLPALSFDIQDLYTIFYEFQPADFITMAIKFKKPNQFFALGFGSRMTGADIWTFELIDNQVVIGDRIGLGNYNPPQEIEVGGTDNLERLGYEITPTYTLVKVRRLLNTGDPQDVEIPKGPVQGMWATAPSTVIAYHGDAKGVLTFPFKTDGLSTENVEAPVESNNDVVVLIENKKGGTFKNDLYRNYHHKY